MKRFYRQYLFDRNSVYRCSPSAKYGGFVNTNFALYSEAIDTPQTLHIRGGDSESM